MKLTTDHERPSASRTSTTWPVATAPSRSYGRQRRPTDYGPAVTVTAAAPTATFGIVGVPVDVGPDAPVQFTDVTDPSNRDGRRFHLLRQPQQRPLRRKLLARRRPAQLCALGSQRRPPGLRRVPAGRPSAVTTLNVMTVQTDVWVDNNGTGALQVDWAGAASPTVIVPGGYLDVGEDLRPDHDAFDLGGELRTTPTPA